MSKSHTVSLSITNNTGISLTYSDDWFDSGRLADGNSWPATIASGATAAVTCYERDASLAGCSGWVKYSAGGTAVFLTFSNPVSGSNGIDIGTATAVWNGMSGHYDCPIERTLHLQGTQWLLASVMSTGGNNNHASWKLTACDTSQVVPANTELRNIPGIFSRFPTVPSRREYLQCSTAPVDVIGVVQSHFKGIASVGSKLVFTHTNLDPTAPGASGKYLIADTVSCGNQGATTGIFDTAHPTWSHPCSSQGCGSFVAMGIQATADGSKASEILIYDARGVQVNQAMTYLTKISIPHDGINGVGMCKETGPAGHYLVAGVNGNTLTIWRSNGPSLLGTGALAPTFTQVYQTGTFAESGAGLALLTQQGDGGIYLFTLNADDGNVNSKIALYRLDNLQQGTPACVKLGEKDMPVTDTSDSVILLAEYSAVVGALAVALLVLGPKYLNSSFRYGKGLAITSPDTIELYASDRNVLPLSSIPVIGSDKDFGLLVWTSNPPLMPSILPKDYLAPGETMQRGDYLVSRSGKYFATIGTDGDLTVFAGTPMDCQGISWKRGQPAEDTYCAAMQTDGNFCCYRGSDAHHTGGWCTSTNGQTNFAIMQDDGNLCIYHGDGPQHQGAFLWGSIQNGGKTSGFLPISDTMAAGSVLYAGAYVPSRSNAYFLTISDGDVCVFAGTPSACLGLSWKLGLTPSGPIVLRVQTDGNFCAYLRSGGPALWCAYTQGQTNFGVMQDDANFCIYHGADTAHQGAFLWGTIQNGAKTSNFGPAPQGWLG